MKHPRLAVAAAVLTLAVGASVAVAYARGDIEFAWEYDDAPAPRPIAAVAPSLPAKPPKPPSAETPPAPAVTDLSVTGASTVSPALDAFIRERMARAGAPGLAAAVVRDHRLVWTAGFGAADLARGAPVTPDTLFILASLSKPVTATALMQLCEQGRFGLDDDINRLLPFRVRNPRYPDRPITARMLLTHTSSIHDDDVVDELVVPGDSPVSLRRFVEGYFVPGGEFYHDTNFGSSALRVEGGREQRPRWHTTAEITSFGGEVRLRRLCARLGLHTKCGRAPTLPAARRAQGASTPTPR